MYPPTDRRLPFQKKPHPAKKYLSAFFYLFLGGFIMFGYQMMSQESSPIEQWFAPPDSPHKAYLQRLEKAGLDTTELGKKWIQVGENALKDSVHIELPFLAKGYFAAADPQALTYRITGERGQILKAEFEFTGEANPEIFMDLYRAGRRANSGFERVASADSSSSVFVYQFTRDREYMLRIQPALLQNIGYKLKIFKAASLAFPVDGKDSEAIKSFWGDRRDGGRRKHKGVDIFAKKGTPALAAVNGYVSRVKEGGLGGKVVWLRDSRISQSLYYAHLDSQMVREGEYVQIGDTVGLVGKTGNARYTPPHLHFGIYQSNIGAVNPWPFLHVLDSTFTPLGRDTSMVREWVRTRQKGVNVYSSANSRSESIITLQKNFPLAVLSVSNDWAEVELDDGVRGFIPSRFLEIPQKEIKKIVVKGRGNILDRNSRDAGILSEFPPTLSLDILAETESYYLVRTSRLQGWVNKEELSSSL